MPRLISSPASTDIFPEGLDFETMAREIAASFERSKAYGVDRFERNKNQVCLSPEQLAVLSSRHGKLLEAVDRSVNVFYTLLKPEYFMFAVVDREGYILKVYAADSLKAVFMERNCGPGFRWREKDVGTSAISLCLEREIPIQVNDKDHYCQRAHIFTSSAAPIFDGNGNLSGVLVASGLSELVHPHTLVMIMNVAKAIERQLQLEEMAEALRREAAFLQNTIDGVSTGVMLVNTDMDIVYLNKSGRNIFRIADGQRANLLAMGMQLDLKSVMKKEKAIENCEILFTGRKKIVIQADIKQVRPEGSKVSGYLINFETARKAQLVAAKISGPQAYFTFENIIGRSPLLLQALNLARTAALTDMPILLQGETGTGKELFAQAIHNACPQRRKNSFVPVNCAAIPSELLESELFGYAPGAFSGALAEGRPGKFELADGGTILLDEIGDMPLPMQAKLLRVLQSREVYRVGSNKAIAFSAKIISSTHVDLPSNVKARLFREDLYYRLGVFPINIPTLRERGPDDLLLLADFILGRNENAGTLTPEARSVLVHHKWPGNIRELENVLQRAAYLAQGEEITAEMLHLANTAGEAGKYRGGTLAQMERALIEDCLKEADWNMAQSAKKLGISRGTLYRKKREYNL